METVDSVIKEVSETALMKTMAHLIKEETRQRGN